MLDVELLLINSPCSKIMHKSECILYVPLELLTVSSMHFWCSFDFRVKWKTLWEKGILIFLLVKQWFSMWQSSIILYWLLDYLTYAFLVKWFWTVMSYILIKPIFWGQLDRTYIWKCKCQVYCTKAYLLNTEVTAQMGLLGIITIVQLFLFLLLCNWIMMFVHLITTVKCKLD